MKPFSPEVNEKITDLFNSELTKPLYTTDNYTLFESPNRFSVEQIDSLILDLFEDQDYGGGVIYDTYFSAWLLGRPFDEILVPGLFSFTASDCITTGAFGTGYDLKVLYIGDHIYFFIGIDEQDERNTVRVVFHTDEPDYADAIISFHALEERSIVFLPNIDYQSLNFNPVFGRPDEFKRKWKSKIFKSLQKPKMKLGILDVLHRMLKERHMTEVLEKRRPDIKALLDENPENPDTELLIDIFFALNLSKDMDKTYTNATDSKLIKKYRDTYGKNVPIPPQEILENIKVLKD